MFKKTIIIPVVCALLLSACSSTMNSHSGFASGDQPSYCETDQGKPVCIAGGLFLTMLVVGIIADSHDSHHGNGGCPGLCEGRR